MCYQHLMTPAKDVGSLIPIISNCSEQISWPNKMPASNLKHKWDSALNPMIPQPLPIPYSKDHNLLSLPISDSIFYTSTGKDEEEKKPSPDVLISLSKILQKDMAHIFIQTPDMSIYRPDLIFENRILQKRSTTLLEYKHQWSVLKIMGHLRYVFVRFMIMRCDILPEDSMIEIRWKALKMSYSKMLMNYFPKKLWNTENITNNSDVWFEGISKFYVDESGKIYLHVADNKEEDRSQVEVRSTSSMEEIKEKLQKLKKNPEVAPV